MANDKLVAILSYITIIGWIIALIINLGNKSKLGSFHIRQSLMLYLCGIIISFIPLVGWILSILIFIFWLMGLVYAIQGKEKEVPIVGGWGQSLFKGL